MRPTSSILPFLSLLMSSTLAAPGIGNQAAINACRGFPNAAVKCLTDVSFTVCLGDEGHGSEQEYFVAPGTHCEQGILGKKIDAANVMGIATVTRTFAQFGVDDKPMTTAAVNTGKLDSSQVDALFATTA